MDLHDNATWIGALGKADSESEKILHDLKIFLEAIVVRLVKNRRGVSSSDVSDLTQEILLRIVANKDTFRGDSLFTTWATTIASRIVFTEIRRRKNHEAAIKSMLSKNVSNVAKIDSQERPMDPVCEGIQPVVAALRLAIESDLTEKQRQVIKAELEGVPTIQIAEAMNTNQNALYKLVHDARKKLRLALSKAGYSSQSISEFLAESRS